jgi:hypothetical protein
MTMTRQQIFDTAVAGLASQGFERSRHDLGCAYTGNPQQTSGKECHCAIGWCIKDVYKSNMEYQSVATLVAAFPETLEKLGFQYSEIITWDDSDVIEFNTDEAKHKMLFLEDLQRAHDNSGYPEDMKRRLFNVGYEWGLVVPEVLQDVEV